jgi:pyridoxamine 5'-phosphate oxidase
MSVDPRHPWDSPSVQIDPLAGMCTFAGQTLPDPLPADPFPLFQSWLQMSADVKSQPNPNAMSLATVDADGQPSVRIVLARRVYPDLGCIVFFTNYDSRKGAAISASHRIAACFHWDHLDRQVRVEGVATVSPAQESNNYFTRRPVMSRVAAWASSQSQPLASRQQLLDANALAEARFGVTGGDERVKSMTPEQVSAIVVPRPPNWGGFRFWVSRMELWLGHSSRLHDRALWTRDLTPTPIDGAPGYTGGAWSVTRLQP